MEIGALDEAGERLRSAALRLFVELGYGSTNVEEIASVAGVGVATFYRRWPDKAALANELVSSTIDYLAEHCTPEGGATQKERFLDFFHKIWGFASHQRERFLLVERNIAGPFINDENRARKTEIGALVLARFGDMGIRAAPELAYSLIVGTIVMLLRDGVSPDPDELGERLWAAVRAPIGDPRPPGAIQLDLR